VALLQSLDKDALGDLNQIRKYSWTEKKSLLFKYEYYYLFWLLQYFPNRSALLSSKIDVLYSQNPELFLKSLSPLTLPVVISLDRFFKNQGEVPYLAYAAVVIVS